MLETWTENTVDLFTVPVYRKKSDGAGRLSEDNFLVILSLVWRRANTLDY
jgi:hypothetical protein